MKTLIFVAGLVAVAAAQQPARDAAGPTPVGTATLAGRVTSDEATPRPLRRAVVTLTGGPLRGQRIVVTDDAGRFAHTQLPPGSYSLSVTKPPYLTTAYGARRPGKPGTPIALAAGQQIADIILKMPRGAVIAGTIRDQLARPVPNVNMRLYQIRVIEGERTLVPVNAPNGGNANTDDRGSYRIFGLPPGEFVIAAASFSSAVQADLRMSDESELAWAEQQVKLAATGGAGATNQPGAAPASGPAVGYAPVYYPGTSDPSASLPIPLAIGEERGGVDFVTRLVPTAKIDGVVLTPDGAPAANTQITLVPRIPGLLSQSTQGRGTDRDGKFSFTNLPPGQYLLSVRWIAGRQGGPGALPPPPPPPAPGSAFTRVVNDASMGGPGGTGGMWAAEEVGVNGKDVSGVSLTLQPDLTISGRVVFEGATPVPPDLSRVRGTMSPVASGGAPSLGAPPVITVRPDGTFVFTGVPPGRFRVSMSVPPATGPAPGPPQTQTWFLKSAVIGGLDVLDSYLEVPRGQNPAGLVVTFTDRVAELSGLLLDARNEPATTFTLVVFSTDKSMWKQASRRTRNARPQPTGQFTIANLPPGEYYMTALSDFDAADLYDASFLEQLITSSYKITLAEGEKKKQDLKLAGGH